MLSPRRVLPRLGSKCPWIVCAIGSLIHLPRLESYPFYSCLSSTICHRVSDVSTRMDFAWGFDIAWTIVDNANPYHKQESVDPSEIMCLFEEYHGPRTTTGRRGLVYDFGIWLIAFWLRILPKPFDCQQTQSPMPVCSDRDWESVGLLREWVLPGND